MRYEESTPTVRNGIFGAVSTQSISGESTFHDVSWVDTNFNPRPNFGIAISSPGTYSTFLNGSGSFSKSNLFFATTVGNATQVNVLVLGVSIPKEKLGGGIEYEYTITYKFTHVGTGPNGSWPPIKYMERIVTGVVSEGLNVAIQFTASDFNWCLLSIISDPIGVYPNRSTITGTFNLGTYSAQVVSGSATFPLIASGMNTLANGRLSRIQGTVAL